MASKAKMTRQKEDVLGKEGPETPPDNPLLDLSNAAVKKFIRAVKKRGYVTFEQINSLSKEKRRAKHRHLSFLANAAHSPGISAT
jgi:hypothetical protein